MHISAPRLRDAAPRGPGGTGKAGDDGDIGQGRKRTFLPPPRSLLLQQAPPLNPNPGPRWQPTSAPQPSTSTPSLGRGAHTKGGASCKEPGWAGGLGPAPEALLPSPKQACPRPPTHPSLCPRTRSPKPGTPRGGRWAARVEGTHRGSRESNSRRRGPRDRRPGRWGRARARAPGGSVRRAGTQAAGRVLPLPSSLHACSRPTAGGPGLGEGRRSRGGGGGGAIGARGAEKARRGPFPSGGRREMQRGCKRAGLGRGGCTPRPAPPLGIASGRGPGSPAGSGGGSRSACLSVRLSVLHPPKATRGP